MLHQKSPRYWERNNRVKLRNPSESMDLHEAIKQSIMRLERRKHPDNLKCFICSEHSVDELDEHFPDVQLIIKNHRTKRTRKLPDEWVDWEIQKEMTKEWKKKILARYARTTRTIIIVDLKKVEKEWNKRLAENILKAKDPSKCKLKPITTLNEVLEDMGYIV